MHGGARDKESADGDAHRSKYVAWSWTTHIMM